MTIFHDWRDRLLGDPAVRAQLARLPIGRMMARRHAGRIFAVMSGFAHSQMLLAAFDVGLFDRLAAGPMHRDALAASIGLPPAGFAALIQALVALQMVERRGNRIGLAIDGLVVASDPGIRAMIDHGRLLYADCADPVAMLRHPGGGWIGAFWPYAGGEGDRAGYSALMAASQSFVGDALCGSYDFGRHTAVMDVGGGDGSFVATLAARWPALRLALVDLPGVAAVAREALAARGLSRVEVHARAGDAAPIPAGADAITLVRVLHDRDDDAALALLRAAAAALPAGGTLVVAEPMARRGRDPQAAYFAAYFAAMGSGRLRSAADIARLIRLAGLRPHRRHMNPSPMLGIVLAQRALKSR